MSAPNANYRYQILDRIGLGTFGQVVRARNCTNNELVAIKIPRSKTDPTFYFEYGILRSLHHENIIRMLDYTQDDEGLFHGIVLELMDFSIANLIDRAPLRIPEDHIKMIMRQVIAGVKYLHENCIIHRDIKINNILLNRSGIAKIIDFGVGVYFAPDRPYLRATCQFGCFNNRPPEILLGSEWYSASVDIWAVGCVFARMILQQPLFLGGNEGGLLYDIFKTLGTPTSVTWPGVESLPGMISMWIKPETNKSSLLFAFLEYQLSEPTFDLIEKLLKLYPESRISASDAYDHVCFGNVGTTASNMQALRQWLNELFASGSS